MPGLFIGSLFLPRLLQFLPGSNQRSIALGPAGLQQGPGGVAHFVLRRLILVELP